MNKLNIPGAVNLGDIIMMDRAYLFCSVLLLFLELATLKYATLLYNNQHTNLQTSEALLL